MKPTAPVATQIQQDCHDTMPWFISFSLDDQWSFVLKQRRAWECRNGKLKFMALDWRLQAKPWRVRRISQILPSCCLIVSLIQF